MNSRAQAGQAVVLVALAAIVIFGMLGVAVDGGRAMINRRALQSAADSASDSAMRMVLQDYHDLVATPSRTPSFTDCNIANRVAEIANASNTNALGSGIDGGANAPIVQYVDPNGVATNAGPGNATSTPSCTGGGATSLNLCTSPGQTGCVAGVAHTPQFTQPTYVMNALGVKTTVQSATSTSVFTIHGPTTGGLGPWVIWDQDCVSTMTYGNGNPVDANSTNPNPNPGPDNDDVVGETSLGANDGDALVFHDEHWSKPSQQAGQITGCGDGKNTASSSFKGFMRSWPNFDLFTLHPVGGPTPDCNTSGGSFIKTVTVLNLGDCVQNLQGGGATGQEPDPCKIANGPSGVGHGLMILTMIDTIDGAGTDYAIRVKGFVAARMVNSADGSDACPPGGISPSASMLARVVFICQNPGSDSTKCVPPQGELIVGSGFLK